MSLSREWIQISGPSTDPCGTPLPDKVPLLR
uniref:Uncharacterized protein n=1 Tax=Anguilla anguilla TaxID=7936 RepID=A0A0E9TKL8_ANGAN